MDLPPAEVEFLYNKYLNATKQLMEDKNHDYGEAWRDMRVSSLTDLILMKIFRVKQIEDNEGKTVISEGVEANYMDMINYSVFALIRLSEVNVKNN
jgi:phage portal protein BeeE